MAITKDGTISGPVSKPRRGVSHSCNGSNGSITVPVGTRRSPSPSSSEKPAPSYLRPTVSSHGDVKKKVPSSPDKAAKKPVLARRSSLDKPPVASHLQKIISSTPRERSVTVRSSSFSGRSGTSYRPVSEKASIAPLKTVKAVSRTTHPGNNIGGKTMARKSVAKRKESSDNASTAVGDASGNDNSRMSSVPEGEKSPSPTREKMGEVAKMAVAVAVEDENATIVQKESGVVMEDHHHAAHPENDVAIKEVVAAEDVVVLATEEDDKNSTVAAQLQMEEIDSDQASNGIAGSTAEAENKEEVEHIVENDVDAEVGDVVEMVANSNGEKQSEDKESEEEKQVVVKPSDNVATVTSARKDPAQANNDVIEETAKKLMESRKNKVRALAGAFETVISLEKPNQA